MSNETLKKMIGKVPVKIWQENEEELFILFDDYSRARFYHPQDCCEDVRITDINGDWGDLIGVPLLVAESRTSDYENRLSNEKIDEDEMWTFYTFRSIKGSVDVRWYGTSNGYYAVGVNIDFKEVVLFSE